MISNLRQIPEGDENIFVRAVSTEWFAVNFIQQSVSEAARQLVERYRVAEFSNANGIKLGSRPDTSFVMPAGQLVAPVLDRGVLPGQVAFNMHPCQSATQSAPNPAASLTPAMTVPPAVVGTPALVPQASVLTHHEDDVDLGLVKKTR